MLRTLILAAAAATLLGLAPMSSQAETYSFTYSDNTNSGDNYSGTLTVNGGFVTAISGTSALYGGITDLFPPGVTFPGGPTTDNVFGTSFPFLSVNGIGFATETFGVILYATSGDLQALGDLAVLTSQLTSSLGNFSIQLVPGPGGPGPRPETIPAPASAALFLAGLAWLGAARRRGA
jgi:uncharacterized protein (TIGR03382 family)